LIDIQILTEAGDVKKKFHESQRKVNIESIH
jgi:hypothetical protein